MFREVIGRSAAFLVAGLELTGTSMAVAWPELGAYETHLHASLAGSPAYPGIRGRAGYERDHGRWLLHVELTGVRQLAGREAIVSAGGYRIGAMHVAEGSECHGDWNAAYGALPIGPGAKVSVRTEDGAPIAHGVLHRDD